MGQGRRIRNKFKRNTPGNRRNGTSNTQLKNMHKNTAGNIGTNLHPTKRSKSRRNSRGENKQQDSGNNGTHGSEHIIYGNNKKVVQGK